MKKGSNINIKPSLMLNTALRGVELIAKSLVAQPNGVTTSLPRFVKLVHTQNGADISL